MSAQDQMKKMLDELMGSNRNGDICEEEIHFTDSRICKAFLFGACPNELFTNTKMDVGPCRKMHSVALREEFEKNPRKHDYGFEEEARQQLQEVINECDRKIVLAKKRLDETTDDPELQDKSEKIMAIAEKIGATLAKAEELGSQGKVDESMKMMAELEELKQFKRQAEDEFRDAMPIASTQQQKLRVCEVCAAYLSLYDNDRRLADHFGGRLHMGFVQVRNKLTYLDQAIADRGKRRQERLEEREKERVRERERETHTRRRSRSRDRDRRRRSRSRDKERRRSRSRERTARRRSRSRSHGRSSRRSRSRSRDRSHRHRSQRSRSRSRDRRRSRRSRSRERRRDRSRSTERRRERSRSLERSHSRRSRSIEKPSGSDMPSADISGSHEEITGEPVPLPPTET
ncbi:putative RNA-binding protein Luc7-like 1 isoform X2 [Sycon ciliatum]|uniref:putative RNA-binding protein Luc7-like 1 isoform X2 n=1 Tax=Sycon ciliatum TaxID=27933 RepID=UPI0031F62D1A|eukprot:scpid61561/ scgid2405/ Putative RNA-binding protein Luc7-like 1; Putative SR protein LUC7B1; SR+89